MFQLRVRKIGGSLGVILPAGVARRLGVRKGGSILLLEAPGRSYRLIPSGSEFDRQMKIAAKGMARYSETLRGLAK